MSNNAKLSPSVFVQRGPLAAMPDRKSVGPCRSHVKALDSPAILTE